MKASPVKWLGIALATVLLCVGILSAVLRSWEKVVSGRGLETFISGYGFEVHHIVLLVTTLVILPIALVIGFGIKRWESRKENDFEK